MKKLIVALAMVMALFASIAPAATAAPKPAATVAPAVVVPANVNTVHCYNRQRSSHKTVKAGGILGKFAKKKYAVSNIWHYEWCNNPLGRDWVRVRWVRSNVHELGSNNDLHCNPLNSNYRHTYFTNYFKDMNGTKWDIRKRMYSLGCSNSGSVTRDVRYSRRSTKKLWVYPWGAPIAKTNVKVDYNNGIGNADARTTLRATLGQRVL